MVIQYFKMVVVNALLISFEMDLRTDLPILKIYTPYLIVNYEDV
jgi:hypothetical protein